ncbi:unnamed protein product [Coregonus sp. 'balchen']|nr:unnamed protein product [Coregonus sp. 'balchen']
MILTYNVLFDTAGTQGIFTRKRHLANLIVSNLQPLSIVEDAGFQAFVDAIKNPGTIIPKETLSIRKDLLRMYEETRQKVEQSLALAHDIDDPVLEALLRKCQKIVRFFHSNKEAEKKLKEAQLHQQLPHHGLIQSVGDGWLSCFHVLKRLAEQYMAINMVLSQRQEFDLCLNGSDITKASSAVATLQPFKDVTEEMSQGCEDISNNQQYYFLSNSIPLVIKLQKKINKEKCGNEVAKQLAKQCTFHFGDLKKSQRLVLTTAPDPRFKNRILNVNDSESANHFLTKLLKDLQAIASPLVVSSAVPNIVQLLKQYMNPLDRAFHETDKMFCSRRSCLEPENINIILFLNINYTS